jgi:hypothetical protein
MADAYAEAGFHVEFSERIIKRGACFVCDGDHTDCSMQVRPSDQTMFISIAELHGRCLADIDLQRTKKEGRPERRSVLRALAVACWGLSFVGGIIGYGQMWLVANCLCFVCGGQLTGNVEMIWAKSNCGIVPIGTCHIACLEPFTAEYKRARNAVVSKCIAKCATKCAMLEALGDCRIVIAGFLRRLAVNDAEIFAAMFAA